MSTNIHIFQIIPFKMLAISEQLGRKPILNLIGEESAETHKVIIVLKLIFIRLHFQYLTVAISS